MKIQFHFPLSCCGLCASSELGAKSFLINGKEGDFLSYEPACSTSNDAAVRAS
jgi:hypothetical protein